MLALSPLLMPAAGQSEDAGLAAVDSGVSATAFEFWVAEAEKGNAVAQFNLGLLYSRGNGAIRDYSEAAKWYRRAALQGDAEAQNNLGVLYQNGQGVTQDFSEAAEWYRLAAAQGDSDAQTNLGALFETGQGVTQDQAEAVRLYRIAAGAGYGKAQLKLALNYTLGIGIPADITAAHMWAEIATISGVDFGSETLNAIAGAMTSQQIVEAQRRARACMESNYQDCD
jgi:TPR repeat protein